MGNTPIRYYYQILQIKTSASQSEIEKAYAIFDVLRVSGLPVLPTPEEKFTALTLYYYVQVKFFSVTPYNNKF